MNTVEIHTAARTTSIRLRTGAGALLLSTSVLALMLPTMARPQQMVACDAGSTGTTSCYITDDTSADAVRIDYSPSTASGNNDGSNAGTYNLTNDANFSPSGTLVQGDQQSAAVFVRMHGQNSGGSGAGDAGKGGSGGTVNIENNGNLTISGATPAPVQSGNDSKLGIWEDTGLLFGIYGATVGGIGADAGADVEGGNGGHGGAGGNTSITNSGTVTINNAMPGGGVGIYGASIGRAGGSQDTLGYFMDQKGGDSGDSKSVDIDNSGHISISGSAAGLVWGIGAEALAQVGGYNASDGGNGGLITIDNSADIDISVTSVTGTIDNGVRGISAFSRGGDAYVASEDNNDSGGDGGGAKTFSITHEGDITVSVAGLDEPSSYEELSGGIVALSIGGNAGDGPQTIANSQKGGDGGVASSSDGSTTKDIESEVWVENSTITTSGDHVMGIAAITAGGNGGEGRESSDGGDGGFGGTVRVYLQHTDISTDGDGAFGVYAVARGGNGGAFKDSSGLVDFGSDKAGEGQIAGNVKTDGYSSTITTTGDHAHGMVVQALGGLGGDATSGFAFVNSGTEDGGIGGQGGDVFLNSRYEITTSGDYAHGTIVQSIGGGGGTADATSGALAVGGDGGVAADGNDIYIEDDVTVTTTGTSAIGLLAQSIGGGGGNAGGANGVVSVGSNAGAGGNGGDITINAYDAPELTIHTSGDFSYGVALQSIGGGGGNGGDVLDMDIGHASVGVGGDGGKGGDGGEVTYNIPADGNFASGDTRITTQGDNAHALIAQSVGGGGGNGGNAVGIDLGTASVQMAGGADTDTGDGLQGGGDGGLVRVSLKPPSGKSTNISTSGSHAIAVLAQSVGGGGGNGGVASSMSANLLFSASMGVGGIGGSGGNGGEVDVALSQGTVSAGANGTTDSHGVVVQSIGGGGGNGGASVSKALAKAVDIPDTDVAVGAAVSAAVGGAGGSGGNGGNISGTLTNSTVTTHGSGAMGMLMQTIGGGGGNGGSSSSSAGVLGGENSVSATLAFAAGGNGGSGGAGGTIDGTIDVGGKVETYGAYSNAFVLQSIGGGGGNAGAGSASTSHQTDGFNLNATFQLGSTGGNADRSGIIHASTVNGTNLITHGSGSKGMIVQSIGGSGGISQGGTFGLGGSGTKGNSATVNVAIGLKNASGGGGNEVHISNYGNITTYGTDSDGILAQSIGGGGGLGGSVGNDAGADTSSDDGLFAGDDEGTSYELSVAIGGTGGTGSNGSLIDMTHGGSLTTHGDHADGIVLQSIGGGGGAGGTSIASGSDATAQIDLAVGGSGGSGGNGGDITLDFDDNGGGTTVVTYGYGAYGVLAQSIGGGGGQGADGSTQAEGGIRLGVDGYGGQDQGGGDVTFSGFVDVQTYGDDAPAMVAQSIAGGGGTAVVGNNASLDVGSHSVDLSLGSTNVTTASFAGEVTLDFAASVNTSGDRSHGIVAQSIGGGGGIAAAGSYQDTESIAIGGGRGYGGAVSVDLGAGGGIQTGGDGSHGIVAQSIGGGGGIAGDSSAGDFDISNWKTSSASGSADAVDVGVHANIVTVGTRSHGVIAQSIAGGGGIGGKHDGAIAGSTGGDMDDSVNHAYDVTVNQTADIAATGEGSIGILAQSQGVFGAGAIDVTVDANLTGGSGSASRGVMVSGGISKAASPSSYNQVTVTENGSIGPSAAGNPAASMAIFYKGFYNNISDGLEVVIEDGGEVVGSVVGYYGDGQAIFFETYDSAGYTEEYGSMSDAPISASLAGNPANGTAALNLINQSGGTLAGAEQYLADVTNHGTLHVSPLSGGQELEIAGAFTQSETGTLVARGDFSEGGTADTINIGGRATLGGTLEIAPVAVALGEERTILTFGGEAEGQFDTVASNLFSFEQRMTDTGLALRVAGSDFSPEEAGLGRQHQAIADYLDRVFATGTTTYADLFGALDTSAGQGSATYANSLSQLAPAAGLASAAANFELSRGRLDTLTSCTEQKGAALAPGHCLSLIATGQQLNQDSRGNAFGYDGGVTTIGIAGHAQFAEDWTLHGTFGYETASFDGDGGYGSSDGENFYLGAALTKHFGPASVTAAVVGSLGSFDVERDVDFEEIEFDTNGNHDVASYAARLRGEYVFGDLAGFYVKPILDLDLIYSSADGYTESGGQDLSLNVSSSDATAFVGTPSVELGAVLGAVGSMELRATGRAGISFSTLDTYDAQASFQGPVGVAGFTNSVALADTVGRIGAGIELVGSERIDLGLSYDGAFNDSYAGHAGSLRLSLRF